MTYEVHPDEDESRKKALWWWSFPAAAGLLVAVFGAILLFGGGDDPTPTDLAVIESPGIPLEPIVFSDTTDEDPTIEGLDEVGINPFMAPDDRAMLFEEELPAETPAGLYGGTLENTCAPEKLIAYLQAHPAKAQAWAQVQGIAVADIPTFISGLTPIVLTTNTAVTNHSFANGQAVAIQATLQAGTAVLVDSAGVPRARCYCGNPLLPPEEPPPPPPPPPMVLCWAEGALFFDWQDVESPIVAETYLGGEYVKVLDVGVHSDGGWGYEIEIQRTGETGWVGIGQVRCNTVCATVNTTTLTIGTASDGSTSVTTGTRVHLTGVTDSGGSSGAVSLIHWGSGPAVGWVATSSLTTVTCTPGECLAMGAPLYLGFGTAPSTFLGTNALSTPRPWSVTPTGKTETIGGVVYVELPVWFDAGWIFSQGGGGYTEVWTELAYLDGVMCDEVPVCFNPNNGPVLVDPLGTAQLTFPVTNATLTGQTQVFAQPPSVWFQIEFLIFEFEPEFRYGWVQFPPQGPSCVAETVCLSASGAAVTTYPTAYASGGTNWGAGPIQAVTTGYVEYGPGNALFHQVEFTDLTTGTQVFGFVEASALSTGACGNTPPPPPAVCDATQAPDYALTYQVINVAANDPDGGLVIHTQPGLTTPSTGVLTYDSTNNPVVSCAVTADGIVWWELAQGGWVSASYLAPDTVTVSPACGPGPFDPTGKNVTVTTSGQFEGLTFPGQSPNPDIAYVFEQGGRSYVQFELGDGSVSGVLDLGANVSGGARSMAYASTVTGLGTPGDIVYLLDISEAGGAVGGYSLLVHLSGCEPQRLQDPAGVVIENLEAVSPTHYDAMNCDFGGPFTTIVVTSGQGTGNGPGDYDFQSFQYAYNGATQLVANGQGQGQGIPPGQPC